MTGLAVAWPISGSRALAEGEPPSSDAPMARRAGAGSAVGVVITVAVGKGTGGGVTGVRDTSVVGVAGGSVAAGAASTPQATISRNKEKISSVDADDNNATNHVQLSPPNHLT